MGPESVAAPANPSEGTAPAEGVSPGRPKSRLRRIFAYGATRGTSEALLGARGLLLAHLLGPQIFGIWALFRLGSQYAAFAELGITRGLEREIARPSNLRTPLTSEEQTRAQTTLGFLLFVGLTIGVLGLVASFLVPDPRLALVLRGLAVVVIAERVWQYGLVFLRARGELKRFALLEVVHAAAQLVLTGSLAYVWGLQGAIVGFAITVFSSVLLLRRRVPMKPAIDRGALRELLRIGFPIGLATIAASALLSADRLVVGAIGGIELLGYYAFAVSIAGVGTTFAWVIRTVIFPDVYGAARTGDPASAVRQHLRMTLFPFAALYPPLLGLGALLIGPAVLLLMPRYEPAIVAAQVFIFTAMTSGMLSLGALGIVAMDRQRVLPPLYGVGFLLSLTLSYTALQLGTGLRGVAVAALLGQTLLAAIVLNILVRGGRRPRPLLLTIRAFLPLVYCVLLVNALYLLLPEREVRWALAAVLIYVVLLTPMLPWLVKQVRSVRDVQIAARAPEAAEIDAGSYSSSTGSEADSGGPA
jgi:O-antigen/teichoic acid export membrane protein